METEKDLEAHPDSYSWQVEVWFESLLSATMLSTQAFLTTMHYSMSIFLYH